MTQVEPIYRLLGAKVEQVRTFLDVTQEELAKRTGLSRATIANMEVGRQRIYLHHVETISKALGTSPKGILRGIWT